MVKVELLSALRYIYKGKMYVKFNSKGEKNVYMVNDRLARELLSFLNERDMPYFVQSMEEATVEEEEHTEEEGVITDETTKEAGTEKAVEV